MRSIEVTLRRELVEHGGRVPGACADVEHALGSVELEQRAHRGDDVRLRDRLALADRERRVVVGVARELRRHELLPREPPRARRGRARLRSRGAAAGARPCASAALRHSMSRPLSRRPPEDVRRRRDAEVTEHERRHVDDAPRRLGRETHGQDRHQRVRRDEGAVRATAEVMPATEVRETPSPPAPRRRPRPRSGTGPRRRPARRRRGGRGSRRHRRARTSRSLGRSAAPRPRAGRRSSLRPGRARPRRTARRRAARRARGRRGGRADAVDVPGTVRGGDERLGHVAVPVAEPRDVAHRRLAVVGHHDHGVALEEGVEPAGRPHEPADRLVAARQHRRRLVGPGRVRRVVVVGEVEEEEVESVAGHEPAAHRGGVCVDRAGGAIPERERARPCARSGRGCRSRSARGRARVPRNGTFGRCRVRPR